MAHKLVYVERKKRTVSKFDFKCSGCHKEIYPVPDFVLMIILDDFVWLIEKRKEHCPFCLKEISVPSFFRKKGELLRFKQAVDDKIAREGIVSSLILLHPFESLGMTEAECNKLCGPPDKKPPAFN